MIRGLCIATVAVTLVAAMGHSSAVLSQHPPAAPRFDTELTPPPPPLGQLPPARPTGPAVMSGPPYQPANPPAYPPVAPPVGATGPRRLPLTDRAPITGPPATGFQPSPINTSAYPPRQGVPSGPPLLAQTSATRPAIPQAPTAELFAPGRIIAWVGDKPIQSGDIMPTIEQMIAPAIAKLPPEEVERQKDQIEAQKQEFLKQALSSAVETKLLYLDFLRTLPDDKRDEILPQITKRAEEQFYKKQLPDAIKKAKVTSAIELNAELRKFGSSVAEQKRLFVERILGQSVLGQSIDYEPEVTHQEMLDYYHDHAEDYARPARARWEKLTVRFDKFPSKSEAWAAIGQMGNEVMGGAPLEAVARRHSQDVDAQDGGQHDWTTQASLASTVLDQAIFSLPLNRLSERLEDERGFHIVRVLEREAAGSVPFLEAQVEIKEKIRKDKIRSEIKEYISTLRDQIVVWTVFDESSAPEAQTAAKPVSGDGTSWPSTYQRR